MSAYLKIDDYEKNLIEEISALSGHSPMIVRDVLELTFIRQVEELLRGKDFPVPYIGRVKARFIKDNFVAGEREAEVECFFAPSPLLKRVVGDIEDGESDLLSSLMRNKLKSALQERLNTKSNKIS